MKGKSSDFQILVRFLNGIVTYMFRDGTGSCTVWSASPEFTGYGHCAGVFSIIFVFYLNYLSSDLSIDFVSIIVSQTSWCHRKIATIFLQIMRWHNFNCFAVFSVHEFSFHGYVRLVNQLI